MTGKGGRRHDRAFKVAALERMAAGLVLATNNRREFARIGGLQLADWIEGG